MMTTDQLQTYRPITDLMPASWQSRMIEVRDGTCLHCYHVGDPTKPALILLHGFMSAGLTWMRLANALENDFHLMLLDMRGHGSSDGVDNGFSLDILTDDLADVIAKLELDKPAVLGHSLGAEIAARFGAAYPHVPRALLLLDPPMRSFDAGLFRQMDWYKNWLAQIKALKTQSHLERMTSGQAFLPPGAPVPQEMDYVTHVEATALFNLDVLDHSGEMDYRAASPDLIGKITAPILLITGHPERGGSVLPEGLSAMQSAWKNGTHIQFDESGHFVHYAQLDALAYAVRNFLNA